MRAELELLPPFLPDVAHVAEETSVREVNVMLREGWKLLLVVAAHDGAGGYPLFVRGKTAAVPVDAPEQ